MDIVLVHPEIPHNAGCAGRLTAAVGARLHLVEPLGFSLEDRYLKRAGLDYWPSVDLVLHADLERAKLFTARGGTSLFRASFVGDDVLFFGSESSGLPAALLEREDMQRIYVPIRREVRSLNLANTVALGLYTALDRSGAALPANDGEYVAHPDAARDVRPGDVVER